MDFISFSVRSSRIREQERVQSVTEHDNIVRLGGIGGFCVDSHTSGNDKEETQN